MIPVDPELSVASVNSTWVEVRWGTFSDYDAQFIDGIQLRYKEVEGKVCSRFKSVYKLFTGTQQVLREILYVFTLESQQLKSYFNHLGAPTLNLSSLIK